MHQAPVPLVLPPLSPGKGQSIYFRTLSTNTSTLRSSVVDIFAPGQYITSSWIGGTTRTNNISGTSIATPHVSGLVAYLIGLNGNQSPAAISSLIKSLGISGVLSNIRECISGDDNCIVLALESASGTVNLLANNGY
ncbi:uncharacterized protein ARMOST_15045 [Armillaria ostoyae]|uniref:Peptidase S8/S53 domain-containing protein n=1 Tax=Armillaria ostoyae TaxID=47428 RepID=A0A284RS98_ARMOS|nr:uncharacterized protein ARMOST_15045 [Armillaria ostoyae]